MEKNKFLAFSAIVGASVLAITVVMGAGQKGWLSALASGTVINKDNEYGCKGNCTGEYEIWHVKQLLQNDPNLNGSENVRFRVKYVGENLYGKWFQDYFQEYNKKDIDYHINELAVFVPCWNDIEKGRTDYKPGDIINLYGTISYEMVGAYTVKISNMVVYGVNNDVDTSLLPSVHYIH